MLGGDLNKWVPLKRIIIDDQGNFGFNMTFDSPDLLLLRDLKIPESPFYTVMEYIKAIIKVELYNLQVQVHHDQLGLKRKVLHFTHSLFLFFKHSGHITISDFFSIIIFLSFNVKLAMNFLPLYKCLFLY